MSPVTELLVAWSGGDASALQQLMPLVHAELYRLARREMRGGGARLVPFEDGLTVGPEPGTDLVALDDALQALAAVDARKSQVVELRFFGGLSVDETAVALNMSPRTVLRDWRLAKAWLLKQLDGRH